jgi:tetratricopeptide (TPR) repeat protein
VPVDLGIPAKNDFMFKRVFLFLIISILVLSFQASGKSIRKTYKTEVSSSVYKLTDSEQRVFDYYFMEAIDLKYKEKFDEAFQLFSYCTLLDSLNPQPWFERAVFFRNINRTDLALEALERAYNLDKNNEWYALGLANMYISLERIPDAIGLYENLSRNKPDDENIMFQLAGLYSQNNNDKQALKTLNNVERLIGKNESVSFEKYKIHKQSGHVKKAIHEIESLIGEFPYDVDYILLLGDAWMDLGYPEKAFPKYMEAQKMEPGNPSVSLSLADYYNGTGDSISAKKQLLSALTNPGTDFETKLSIFTPLLTSSVEKGDSVEIAKYFDILLEQHPNEYQLRELHVKWLLDRGMKQEAKDELRTVLDLNPNQLKAWKNYLELNLEYDNQVIIRDLCNEALTYFPKEPLFWFYLGLSWTSENEGKTKDAEKSLKAVDAFQKGIEVANPDDKAFISRLYGITGDTYLLLNDTAKAFSLYDKALEEFPGNMLVLNNYAYYLSVSGSDLSKAERMSRKTIEADPKNSTYLDTFAWIFFKLGKYSLAKIYIERAMSNEKNHSHEIVEHYGDILWFNDEKENARLQWKKAAELDDPSAILLKKVELGTYIPE